MRLLLLLSALLTALSGIAGARANAQPVQASAPAVLAVAAVRLVAPVVRRPVVPAYDPLPPLQLGTRPLVAAVTARLLYAERRRE